jgi:hypothetical protein
MVATFEAVHRGGSSNELSLLRGLAASFASSNNFAQALTIIILVVIFMLAALLELVQVHPVVVVLGIEGDGLEIEIISRNDLLPSSGSCRDGCGSCSSCGARTSCRRNTCAGAARNGSLIMILNG